MSEESIFERADFEEINEWLSYGIEEYYKIYEEKCDPELLEYWDKHIKYRDIIGCDSGSHLSGLEVALLVDEKANQAQLIWTNCSGSFPMGEIISPVNDNTIFLEFERALEEEYENWPVATFIHTDSINSDVLNKTRFKKLLEKKVFPWWPDYMPPRDEWFEKLYEINDFNKFNEWKSTFRRNNKLM